MFADNGRVSRVHENEGAGAEGALHLAHLEALLAEEGGLLIADHARNGNGNAEVFRQGIAEMGRRGKHFRQAGPGMSKSFKSSSSQSRL